MNTDHHTTDFHTGQKLRAPRCISPDGTIEVVAVNRAPNPKWQLKVKAPGGLPFLITKAILLAWQREAS